MATKLTREAERASTTGDFYKLAEMHNKQTLELVEVILAKHTATMLEAIHALAAKMHISISVSDVRNKAALKEAYGAQTTVNRGGMVAS